MDPSSEDLGTFPLSEIIPQLFATIRSVEVAYADYPEAQAILSRMAGLLTDERLELAQRADSDPAAARRLGRLLFALNEIYFPISGMMFGKLSPMAHFELIDLSTPIILLVTHGLATIQRIEQDAAN